MCARAPRHLNEVACEYNVHQLCRTLILGRAAVVCASLLADVIRGVRRRTKTEETHTVKQKKMLVISTIWPLPSKHIRGGILLL